MITFSLLSFLTLGSPAALADQAPRIRYAEAYPCAQVQQVVRSNGRALVYSRSAYAPVDLYELVFANGCPNRAGASKPYWVRTRDHASCFAGYICGQENRGGR